MEESLEVIPQQEVGTGLVKRSEICIGLSTTLTLVLPENTVTGITIVTAQQVTNDMPGGTELVRNNTLKITQGI